MFRFYSFYTMSVSELHLSEGLLLKRMPAHACTGFLLTPWHCISPSSDARSKSWGGVPRATFPPCLA